MGSGLASRFVLPVGLAGDLGELAFPMELKLPERNQTKLKLKQMIRKC